MKQSPRIQFHESFSSFGNLLKSHLDDWITIHSETKEQRRRGRLLAQFIIIFIVLAAAITVSNLLNWLLASSIQDREYLPLDIFSLIILWEVWRLNRQGYTGFTAHVVLIGCLVGGSLIYITDYDKVALVYFVFPIFLSSFVLKPGWSFIYAIFSITSYRLAHLAGSQANTYAIEADFIYLALAAISYLSATLLEGAIDNAQRSEDEYRELVERVPAIIYTAALDEAKTRSYVSPQIERILGFTPAENLADPDLWRKQLHPDDIQRIISEAEYFYTTGEPFISDYRSIAHDGRIVWLHDEAVILQDETGKRRVIHGVQMDITERKQMEAKLNDHLARLASMRVIDTAIMSTHDEQMIFYIILNQAISKLKVDAASILLINPTTGDLEFGAAQGFNTLENEQAHIQLGREIAAPVIEEGIGTSQHNIKKKDYPVNASLLANEEFTCFYAVPLINKGRIKGILNVFLREHRNHDRDWIDFLNALANQAAIAINNAVIFNDLRLAYETTLEGWSSALDLRDRETEGHTQRVTQITEKIAESMGISGDRLLNIRRGALLHDIGKMGIPDKILHKRGPLTKREWQIMRKHPQFAYDLLYPIAYLREALDIPFYHHEKWDGSGYPHGLKGEEIPLAARIFAIVDVYDALTSDRPYRKGWAKDETIKHIADEAGKHFDPFITEIFIEEIKKQ